MHNILHKHLSCVCYPSELPKHMLLLDVKTRWNSLYLMMERFCEQFSAIQAAARDPRIRKPMEKERWEILKDHDNVAYFKLTLFLFVYATCIFCVFVLFISQTGQNGQWGPKKSRGVCAAHAKALHLHTGSLQWQKSDLWWDFAHPAKATATLHRAGRWLCLHRKHQGEHLERSFHMLPGTIDGHK